MSKKEERQIEEKVFKQTVQDEINKIINPPEENEAPIILTAKERQKAEIDRQNEIARRKRLNKLNEKRQMEEEYMGAVAAKKNAKARKIAHHRHRKNFGWWIFGFFSFILVIVIAVGVVFALIPIKTYFGGKSDKYVKDEIAESTPLQIVQNITTYKAGDIPAIELLFNTLLEDYGLNKYISIDIDGINKATLVSSEFTTALSNGIKIIATLRSLGVADTMGELGETSAFKDFELVEKENLPDFNHDEFNEKLYYYQLADGSYARAFDDEGNRIAESNGKDLYLPALVDVMLLDLPAVLADRLETMRVAELLNCFGMDESNTFTQIIGEERTIGQMKDFDINEVKISVALPVDSNDSLKESLVDMTYLSVMDNLPRQEYLKENKDKTKEDWNNLSEEDKNTYIDSLIIKKACEKYLEEDSGRTKEDWDTLSVEDKDAYIDNFVYSYYHLLNNTKTKEDWDNLSSENKREYGVKAALDYPGSTDEQYDLITIGDLANADMDLIKMKSFIKLPAKTDPNYTRIARIYKILLDATYEGEYTDKNFEEVCNQVTLKSLSNMDTDKIRLVTVLDEKANVDIYNILRDMTYAEENGQMRVGDLTRTDITHIRLYNVLPVRDNEKIYGVLLDISYENVMEQLIIDQMIKEKMATDDATYVSNGTTYYWKDYYSWDYNTKANATKSLRDEYDGLLRAEQDSRRQTQEVYYETLDKEEKQKLITVASLDRASVDDLKLSSVVTVGEGGTQNKILNKLLEKETKVGNLSSAINDLTIAEIYGDKVFTNDVSKAVVFADKKVARYSYNESTGIYQEEEVLEGIESSTSLPSAPGNYYISEDASIWLFMLYDAEGGVIDSYGFVDKYKSNGKTLGSIDDSIGSMSKIIRESSVRQLVAAGILDNKDYAGKYTSTMSSLLSGS